MRYFFSTGEASGELIAVSIAGAIRRLDARAEFEGIGAGRMHDAGFHLWRNHVGWASMGPLAAIPRIPKLLTIVYLTAAHVARTKPDLVVLVDFGAFNVRLAKILRRIGYAGPILDVFPPGTWLDDERGARALAAVAVPLTAFARQRDFFESLGLPIQYFGHPLASVYDLRPPHPAPPSDGGTVALLPGSRRAELRYHAPALFEAYGILKTQRPNLCGIVGAAGEAAERTLRAQAVRLHVSDIRFVPGTPAAIRDADAAWVASGTAVLECALSGVPCAALYIMSPGLAKYAFRIYGGRFITLPNLVLDREIVPEFVQDHATPERLAQTMDRLLSDPACQYEEFAALRAALGPDDALERCAAFAVRLAKSGKPAC